MISEGGVCDRWCVLMCVECVIGVGVVYDC